MRRHPNVLVLLSGILFSVLILGCGSERGKKVETSSAPTPVTQTASIHPTPPPGTDGTTVIVKLGNEQITYGRLRRYMDVRKAVAMAQTAGQDDLQPYLVSQMEKSINRVIEEWLLLREAHRLGLKATAKEIDSLIRQTKSLLTEEQFKKHMEALRAKGRDPDILFANQVLITKAQQQRDQQFKKEITPEVKQEWYTEHKDTYFSPPAVTDVRRVCLLYGKKRRPEAASQELRKLLTQVQKRFETVKDMTGRIEIMKQMAFGHSETADAQYSSGLHNIIHVPKAWPFIGKKYNDITKRTPVGVLSDIVPIPNGYSFFYVTKQTPAVVQSFESPTAQNLLPHLILQEKREQWREHKRAEYNVEYFRDRLESCVKRDLALAMRNARRVRASAESQSQVHVAPARDSASALKNGATPARLPAAGAASSGKGS